MYCPNCGKELPEDRGPCVRCGHRVPALLARPSGPGAPPTPLWEIATIDRGSYTPPDGPLRYYFWLPRAADPVYADTEWVEEPDVAGADPTPLARFHLSLLVDKLRARGWELTGVQGPQWWRLELRRRGVG